ncbi:MAG TPA: LamG-like jellyroll fold domain-containing protein, partial [Verrucomicrobiae bacterium]
LFQGGTAHFGVSVISGVATGYQWRRNGSNLSDGVKYSGTATANLTVNSLAAGDAGSYDVVVSTAVGQGFSTNAMLYVQATNGGAFETSVRAANPVAYYRLNELADPATYPPAFDFIAAANGVYGADVQNGFNAVAGPTPAEGFSGFTSTNVAANITLADTNAVVALKPWNLNTNTVTITAWINPSAQQVSGAGVVYTRSTNLMVCGLAYHGAANGNGDYSLGYNWNDQIFAWNWTSGLLVPQNQWSLAALVVTPTNATVYVINTNGIHYAVNTANHVVQAFNDTIYIGTDPASATGGRNFQGRIDEVAAFNQSLSPNQIYALYAAAAGSVLPPQITQQPVSQTLYAGQPVNMGVSAIGPGPLTYQWRAGSGGNFTNLTDGGSLTGSANTTLRLSSLALANVADYEVVVANAGGSVTSSVVHLAIAAVPVNNYDSLVLGNGAGGKLIAYYTLDELADPTAGGVVAYDYAGGHNGSYGLAMQNGNALYNIAGPRPVDGFLAFSATNTAAAWSYGNPA